MTVRRILLSTDAVGGVWTYTVDLAGKFVMPGIINLHCHLGNTVDLAQDPKNFTRANVEAQLAQYARALEAVHGTKVTSMLLRV